MPFDDHSHEEAWAPTTKEGILLSLGLLLVYFIAMAVNFGVMWYECIVPDSHRTLVNKVVALASLYKAAFATAFLTPISARLLVFDHIWNPLCQLHKFAVLSALVLIFLAHNQLVFLRYVYTCRLSTVGAIKEDLVMAITWWLNLVFGGFFTAVTICLTETGNNLYRFCVGNAANIAGKNANTVERN